MLSIDDAKLDPRHLGWVKYVLRWATVYQSPSGYLFTDYLDDESAVAREVDPTALTEVLRRYITDELTSDRERVEHQVELVRRYAGAGRIRVLDVGCGGGLFLSRMRDAGAEVEGTDLNDAHVLYARRTHQLTVHKQLLESPFFQRERGASYDAITLWDVLEHVNFPAQTLASAAALLKPGGCLLLGTPCRDGWLHQIGELTYRLSRGRYPTLLNLMYSNHRYGHKQILSRSEVGELLALAGLAVELLRPMHELALPYESYLRKLLPSARAASLLAPAARTFFTLLPLPNKVLAVARKA